MAHHQGMGLLALNHVLLGRPMQSDFFHIPGSRQSWAVLAGARNRERVTVAMESAVERLVRHSEQLIQLFDPPFDRSGVNPGYIKGYVPGVQENGGQYTHAAVWMVAKPWRNWGSPGCA